MTQDVASISSTILAPLTKVTTKIAPILTKSILPGLATGVTTSMGSMAIDSIFGNGLIEEKMRDIVTAIAIISNEIQKLNKNDKAKFDQIMITGNFQMKGDFLGTLLASIGIPMILNALTRQGLQNTPPDTGGDKEHKPGIPIPSTKQPVVKQPEGTSLINEKWEPYNPPPFYDQYDIKGVEGYRVKKEKESGPGILFGKNSPFKNVPLLNILL